MSYDTYTSDCKLDIKQAHRCPENCVTFYLYFYDSGKNAGVTKILYSKKNQFDT